MAKPTQKKGLGRGLDALWNQNAEIEKEEQQGSVTEIAIEQIDPNREQARKDFDPERLQELAASIRQTGIIQPLILRKNGDRYFIVAGERRWRAARMAGLRTVPALIRKYDDKSLMEVSLIENLQRADLNPIEEAAGIRLLMQQHDLTQEEVAERIGRSRPAVANALRLLNLPEEILSLLRSGELSAGHGRCLAGLPNAALQLQAAKEIREKALSVRQTEALCKALAEQNNRPAAERKPHRLAPELYDVQNALQGALGTKVLLQGNEKHGKIVIEYYSRDQLEQLYDFLSRDDFAQH